MWATCGGRRRLRRTRAIACAFAVAGCACTAPASGAPALGSGPSAVILHPGQSKKIGHYTVVCTTGHGRRTTSRIVLSVGFQLKVKGILVRCAPKPAHGTRADPLPIGAAGTAPGASSTPESSWTIVVNSIDRDAWAAVQAANMFNDPPPAGSVDFMVSLKVTLNGTQAGDTLDLTPFLDAVGSSGVSYGTSQDCGVLPSPSDLDYSTLSPGAAFRLNYCWQVPQSDVPSLEMFWSGGSAPGPYWALH